MDFNKKLALFKEGFKSPKWQKLRLEVLDRDGWKCVRCGDDKSQLHVHHPVYNPDFIYPYSYSAQELVSLCDGCHEDEHLVLKVNQAEVLLCLVRVGYYGAYDLEDVMSFLNTFKGDEFKKFVAKRMRGEI